MGPNRRTPFARPWFRPGKQAAVAALLSLAALTAGAHHGFTGRYDASQPLWLAGEVTRVYFGQPHPEVTIRVPQALAAPGAAPTGDAGPAPRVRPDTLGRELKIEFPPLRPFFDLGSRVRPGDRVSVIALRNCEPPHQLRGQWIQPALGEPVERRGRVQYQVERC